MLDRLTEDCQPILTHRRPFYEVQLWFCYQEGMGILWDIDSWCEGENH